MALDRTSAKGTETVIADLLPDPLQRDQVLPILAECIAYASKHKERWSITLTDKVVRLNAGTIFVVDLKPAGLRFVVDSTRLTVEQRDGVTAAGCTFKSEKFRLFDYDVAYVSAGTVAAVWPLLKAAAFLAIDGAAAWGKCPFRNAHSPGVLKYLATRTEPALALGDVEEPATARSSSSLGELLRRSYSSANLYFTDDQIANFFTALQVKGFVILTGISGTGKSKLAQHFVDALGATASVGEEGEVDEVSRMRTRPYMFKHAHFIVPRRIAELIEGPEPGESVEIDLEFPGGSERVRLSNRKYTSTAYLVVGLRGAAREWFKNVLSKVDSFQLERVTAPDGSLKGLRVVVAKSASSAPVALHKFLSVRPDWRDGTELLGFYNPVTETYESRPFVEFLEEALESWERKETRPYIVLLDEMNLARVEYYFADVLSVLESGRRADGCTVQPIQLIYPESASTTDAPRRQLFIPPNFFVVGTINSDETTHAFSPKVLDRAFSIELNDVNFDSSYGDVATPLTQQEQAIVAKAFSTGGRYPRGDRAAAEKLLATHPEIRTRLQDLTEALQPFEMHFGYRVFDEIVTFLVHAERNGLFGEDWLDDALDAAVLMKVLPKFHGSRAKLERPLLTMLRWCVVPDDESAANDEAYASLESVLSKTASDQDLQMPATASRIRRMLRTLGAAGFASFG